MLRAFPQFTPSVKQQPGAFATAGTLPSSFAGGMGVTNPLAQQTAGGMPVTEQIVSQMNKELSLDSLNIPLHDRFSRTYTGLYPPMVSSNFFKFPDFLLEQIHSAECKCFMGIFAELNRVWLTVDNRLFIWNYLNDSDFVAFEGLADIVLTVGLARPKPGIFHEAVQHLIVVVTSTDIHLFGASIIDDSFQMYSTELSVSTDNVLMLSVCSTSNGQIFLGGRNGNLYELVYEAEESWFSRKCYIKCLNSSVISNFIPTFLSRKAGAIISVIVDEKRQLLYTLSEDSEIGIYQLNVHENKLFEVNYTSRYSVAEECKKFMGRSTEANLVGEGFQALAAYVVHSESVTAIGKSLGLVVVTSRGYRLYFVVEPGNASRGLGVSLDLDHVRGLPSIEDERDVSNRALPFAQFDTSFYAAGFYFIAGTSAQAGNILFSASLDAGSVVKARTFSEWSSVATGMRRVWDIAETTNVVNVKTNVLSSQVISLPREFVFLTNEGIFLMTQQRPVDVFIELLMRSSGYENRDLKRFVDSYPEDQVCAMALAIVCANPCVLGSTEQTSPIDSQVRSWANQVLMKYGTSLPQTRFSEYDSTNISGPFSDGHYGILLKASIIYISRLAAPIWTRKIVDFAVEDKQKLNLLLTCGKQLNIILHQIVASISMEPAEVSIFEAFFMILEHITQGCNFLLLAIPAGVRPLIERIPAESLKYASICTFSAFTCSAAGNEIVHEMTKLMIQDIIAANANIDPICSNLREGCPLFFRAEDIMIYKAQELIQSAKQRKEDPIELLTAAMKHLIAASQSIPFNTLKKVSEDFRNLGYPEGSITLPVICAQKLDPQNTSLMYYRNPSISEYAALYHNRVEVYQIAFDTIRETIAGLPTTPDIQTQEFYRNSPVIKEVLKSSDILFLSLFYDLMLQERQLVYLIKIPGAPLLQDYLIDRKFEKAELGFYLGMWYRNTRQYDLAIMTFRDLAQSPLSAANLEKRLEYLSWALNIMQSQLAVQTEPEGFSDLKDEYDVALVQFDILKCLEAIGPRLPAIHDLNRNLFSVSELYAICDQHNLNECKLAIFRISNHRDENLLAETWQSILAAQEDRYSKIVALGEKFGHNDIAFPVDIIVTLLEKEAYESNPDEIHDWIFLSILEAGFKFAEVFAVYDRLFEEKRHPFSEKEGQLYILSQILALFESWKQTAPTKEDVEIIEERAARYASQLSIISKSQKSIRLANSFISITEN